jgi:anti-anti-sigma factor
MTADFNAQLDIQSSSLGLVMFLRLSGHATAANHATLTNAFRHAQESIQASDAPGGGLVLNLSGMETISSSAIGAMLSLSRELAKTGRGLVLAAVSQSCVDVLDLLRLQDVFQIFPTENAAHASLGASNPDVIL